MLGKDEGLFVEQGLQLDLRLDGRSHAEYRSTAIQVGVIRQASGSARCSIGSTEVIVAVKAEVGVPTEDAPDCGGFQLSVEYSTCASVEDVEETAARLNAALDRSLRGSVTGKGGALNLHDLCILPGKHCWVLCMDALVLSAAGNVMDALSLAIKAALADTRIPLVEITATEVADDEPELDVDDDLTHARRLDISSIPLTSTVNQVGQMVALDCSVEEESCSTAAVHISTDEHGNICSILKTGMGAVRTSLLPDMMYLAQQRGKGLFAALAAFIN